MRQQAHHPGFPRHEWLILSPANGVPTLRGAHLPSAVVVSLDEDLSATGEALDDPVPARRLDEGYIPQVYQRIVWLYQILNGLPHPLVVVLGASAVPYNRPVVPVGVGQEPSRHDGTPDPW